MPLVADRVKETTTTTGTGTLTLAGAATGFQSFFAAFGAGAAVYYVIAAGADWEIGIGTTGSGTLSRDTVLQSSNGDALVDWTAGAKDVFCAYVADRAVTTSDASTLTNKTIDSYTNDVGANSTHFRIKAGATLAKGDVVKAVGFTPGAAAIEVVKVASSSDTAIGICEQALNTGNFGLAVVIGELFNVNTNGFTLGDTLYSNGAGGFTATRPASGTYQSLGNIVRANTNNGVIAVNVVNPQYVEASTSTANTLVLRDGSGNFAAGTITATLSGNASTATSATSATTAGALSPGATINGTTFTGASNITITAANPNALTLGSGLTGTSYTGSAAVTATVDSATASTASKIVARDANGSSSFKNVKLDGTTSGTVTVQPAAAAGTWSLTLPTSGGTNGQVLTTDGSGGTSWSTVGGQTVVGTTTSYNLTTADAGKQIVYTGTASTSTFFAGASLASGLSTGQFVDIANNGSVNIVVGGSQVFDQSYSTVQPSGTFVFRTAKYPNGKVIIADTSGQVYRLNADGTYDNTFPLITTNGFIRDIDISSDGAAVFVAGSFTQVTQNGSTVNRNAVVKLNGTTGIIDTSFIPFGGITDVFSVAVSGTTVAATYQGSGQFVAFMSSTTGANLGGSWSQYEAANVFGFVQLPVVKRHPTTANRFIGFCYSGYYYIDGDLNYSYYYGSVFEFTTGSATSYSNTAYASVPDTPRNQAILITSTYIYWAVASGASSMNVYRLTIGTYGSGLLNNSIYVGAYSSFSCVSVFMRPTDSVVFIGTDTHPGNGSVTSLYSMSPTTLSANPNIVVSAIGGAYGIFGQGLSDGSLLISTVVVSGVQARYAKTLTTTEAGATIAYPAYMSGSNPIAGFTSATGQTFRQYQTMRLQKMSNGNLLVTQRNTPYQ